MNIWVNGCFDIIHTGHIDLLWFAKLFDTKHLPIADAKKTNKLFVGLDTDERVTLLKGDNRPINGIDERVKMLQNLRMVDVVATFHNEAELEYLIRTFNIDYIIVGDQYKDKRVVGSEFAKEKVIFYPTDKRSSTNIIEKIKKL